MAGTSPAMTLLFYDDVVLSKLPCALGHAEPVEDVLYLRMMPLHPT
jgi:hypothetical protein